MHTTQTRSFGSMNLDPYQGVYDKITTWLFFPWRIQGYSLFYAQSVQRELYERSSVQAGLLHQPLNQPRMDGSHFDVNIHTYGHMLMIMAALWSYCGQFMVGLRVCTSILASLVTRSLLPSARDLSFRLLEDAWISGRKNNSPEIGLMFKLFNLCLFAKAVVNHYVSLAHVCAKEKHDEEHSRHSHRPFEHRRHRQLPNLHPETSQACQSRITWRISHSGMPAGELSDRNRQAVNSVCCGSLLRGKEPHA